MGNRAKIKGPEKKAYVDLQFMNWLAQFCAMVMPRKLRLVAGRGSAKTTEIQVERLIEMVYDMPGAPVAWVADTFANLTANVLPMVFEALERKGFRDGVHYVVEKQPPTFTEKECADLPKWLKPYFWKPYNKIISYKRTIVFFTGLNITFGSLDRPASLAGRSYVHVFGDEVKYFAEAKIGNLLTARRGYRLQFGHSPFYLGETFTTDMPNTGNTGEYDWIFKGAKEMDPETLLLVWKTASIANDAVQEYIAAKEKFYRTQSDADRQEYLNKYKTANRWMERWYNLRHHEKPQSMFLIVSSSYPRNGSPTRSPHSSPTSMPQYCRCLPASRRDSSSTPTWANATSIQTGTSRPWKRHSASMTPRTAVCSGTSIPTVQSTCRWTSATCSPCS